MSAEQSPPPLETRPSRRPRPLSVLGLAFAAILIVVLGVATYAGYRAGLDDRHAQAQATQTADLQRQFQLGLEDLAQERYSMAAQRFQYIVNLDPSFPDAAGKLAEAQAALQITPTPSPPPEPTASGESPEEIFALAQQYYEAGNWDGVIAQIRRLHSMADLYRAAEADQLLAAALRRRGVARIQSDQMEAGIFDLDQASAFGPLDSEALNYRAWARLYLAARSYWGVNWAEAAAILRQLYVLAPNFKDTTRLLYQATLNYAQQLALAGEACAAAEQYAYAETLFSDPAVAEALTIAQTNCALTPTPTEAPLLQDTPTPEP